ncbi:MAG: ABC transporter ATP-binding protein [Acidobacteria bacterium]|nr:ABC transporter ATP-binding protein [Acidobacteriota bacterium]
MIRYERFTKVYGAHTAVDALTLDVPPGVVIALLGPNGSGKTTSIKAAAGLIRPTSGSVRLGSAGLPATDAAARHLCAFLPQRVSFPDALTGREVVDFYRRMRNLPADSVDRVMRFASLNGAGSRAVGTYSGGMTQRLGLAVAMLPEAELLLLDEPTAALDPDGLAAFHDLVAARRRAGSTVFFSSHQLGDVERLADLVIIVIAGRLAATLTSSELAARLAERGVMRVRVDEATPALLARVRDVAPGADAAGRDLSVPGPTAARLAALDAIRAAGASVESLSAEEGRLDEFYRSIVGGAP